tara:strand:+ start:3876 stop:4373 length:498 start_codon:yes stop_codon:yes gene_type:complete
MTNNSLQDSEKRDLAKSFNSTVSKLYKDLVANADGENIIVGTKEDPIVSDSDKLPIEHFFMDNVYIRKMSMFKDTVVVGAVHKHLHMCFLLVGHITVSSKEGTVDYKAPCHVVATPGIQRVLYAHEDSIWYNTHKNPTNTKDTKQLEEEIVSITQEDYEEYIKNK